MKRHILSQVGAAAWDTPLQALPLRIHNGDTSKKTAPLSPFSAVSSMINFWVLVLKYASRLGKNICTVVAEACILSKSHRKSAVQELGSSPRPYLALRDLDL